MKHKKETGSIVTETRSVQYERVSGFDSRKDQQRILLARTIRTARTDDAQEGEESQLKVDFFMSSPDQKTFSAKPARTLEIPNAHETKFRRNHWQASTWGCCAAELYSRLYSYDSDKPFLRFNESYWTMEIPNKSDEMRFVGMLLRDHTPVKAGEEAAFGKHPDAVACVSFADLNGALGTVYLKAKARNTTEPLGLFSGEIRIIPDSAKDEVNEQEKSVRQWTADSYNTPKDTAPKFSNATIRAVIYANDDTETLTVRMMNDRLAGPKTEGNVLSAYLEGKP